MQLQLMSKYRVSLLLLLSVSLGQSAPAPVLLNQHESNLADVKSLQQQWLDRSRPDDGRTRFSLPLYDGALSSRVAEIELKRQGFLYGPSLLGNTSYFPTGPLGSAMAQQHVDQWLQDAKWLTRTVEAESVAATTELDRYGDIKQIDDYQTLYIGQWQSSVPSGIAPGALSNGTHDLLFSMERLSVNPYAVRRLHPTADSLPFEIDSMVSQQISGLDIHSLHQSGRLFYANHSYQAAYPVSTDRYSAACSAYFFIHPVSDEFLPLAIKTNVGADLIYTPEDGEEDWLLAKTMFNMNDLFHGQIFHLANSHAVNEIIHQAALRTMSGSHPILGVLDRLMHQAYAIRPIGEKFLFNSDGYFDQSFAITNVGVRQYATDFYTNAAGPFQANYFLTDLKARGLIDCTYGPELKSFPFFEDAGVLHAAIHDFMVSFVDAYYTFDAVLAQDYELQSWLLEANEQARAVDFPQSPLLCKETLVDILTQFAFLSGVSHHVLNSGEPVATSGVLPFHPSALYAPPPATKGVRDLMPYLTPAKEAVKHVALLARFNRPRLEYTNETMLYMFSSTEFLERCHPSIGLAASTFYLRMQAFSDRVQARSFDLRGLSQGMPFVWQTLDPARIPYFLSV